MIGRRFLATLLMTVIAITIAAEPAPAQSPRVKDRVEFNKLVQQRNRLYARLLALDESASRMLLNGEKPLVVHAEQVSVQDQLDLVELRLSILAGRHGLDVPPLPGRDPGPGLEGDDLDPAASRKIEKAFARGRDRAVERLRADGRRLLASLDFSAFLLD